MDKDTTQVFRDHKMVSNPAHTQSKAGDELKK